jgi:deoxyribonuclease IV
MTAKFGPAGNSDSFYEQGYTSSLDMPKWLREMGLDAYEYSCSRGVRVGEQTARELGKRAREHNIVLSIHAPYYINLANPDTDKIRNSKNYILDSMKAAQWMGATRVVFHPGSCSKDVRRDALDRALKVLKETLEEADALGYGDITLCPETLGKKNQLGTLEEVLELCQIDERIIPTIDFGHVHVYDLGRFKSTEDFDKVLDIIEKSLGKERFKIIHSHFSRIEFTKMGEKKHWTLADTQHGPDFDMLAPLLVKRDMSPTIICESRGTMAEDAIILKNIYNENLSQS